jgi:hypothetical protein
MSKRVERIASPTSSYLLVVCFTVRFCTIMFRKFPVFLLALLILMSACAPASTAIPAPVPTQEIVKVVPSVVPSSIPVATQTSAPTVPKQKDLIFIEFFAIT